VNGAKKGEEEFCEAVKVDVSKTKEKYFQASITNTIALASVLFEDFGVAVEVLEKAKHYKTTEEAFPSGHLILFNETFEFEQGFLKKEFNAVQKKCLKSLEALCVFGYRELYKNFLLILVEMRNISPETYYGFVWCVDWTDSCTYDAKRKIRTNQV